MIYKTNNVRMYYRSGTDGHCCIEAWQTLRFHTPGGSTLLREIMATILKL